MRSHVRFNLVRFSDDHFCLKSVRQLTDETLGEREVSA